MILTTPRRVARSQRAAPRFASLVLRSGSSKRLFTLSSLSGFHSNARSSPQFRVRRSRRIAGAEGSLLFLADGNGDFATDIGMAVDASERGMGIRSQRYAMLVRDGIVAELGVEEARGVVAASGA